MKKLKKLSLEDIFDHKKFMAGPTNLEQVKLLGELKDANKKLGKALKDLRKGLLNPNTNDEAYIDSESSAAAIIEARVELNSIINKLDLNAAIPFLKRYLFIFDIEVQKPVLPDWELKKKIKAILDDKEHTEIYKVKEINKLMNLKLAKSWGADMDISIVCGELLNPTKPTEFIKTNNYAHFGDKIEFSENFCAEDINAYVQVGFNSENFDIPSCVKNIKGYAPVASFDILRYIWNDLGLGDTYNGKAYGQLGLNDLHQWFFGSEGKNEDPLQMVIDYQSEEADSDGFIDRFISYCQNDVKMTRDILLLLCVSGGKLTLPLRNDYLG